MKRYLLSYVGAYTVSGLVYVVMFLVGMTQWLFSETPIWFDVSCVLAVILPILALGQLAGRYPGKQPPVKPIIGLGLLLTVMAMMALAGEFVEPLQMISLPGALVGVAIGEILHITGYWDGALPLIGNLLVPVVYHLGWCWGREKKIDQP